MLVWLHYFDDFPAFQKPDACGNCCMQIDKLQSVVYYIQSHEIQENIDEVYFIFSLVKYKTLYFHSTGVYI